MLLEAFYTGADKKKKEKKFEVWCRIRVVAFTPAGTTFGHFLRALFFAAVIIVRTYVSNNKQLVLMNP